MNICVAHEAGEWHVVAGQTYVITRLKAPGCLPASHFKQLKRS